MEMLVYVILAAVVYGIVAEYSDRAVEREMRKRLADDPSTAGEHTSSMPASALPTGVLHYAPRALGRHSRDRTLRRLRATAHRQDRR